MYKYQCLLRVRVRRWPGETLWVGGSHASDMYSNQLWQWPKAVRRHISKMDITRNTSKSTIIAVPCSRPRTAMQPVWGTMVAMVMPRV